MINRIEVKYRKYSKRYLKYRFSAIDDKTQYIECCEVLSTENMKSSKLIQELEIKHLSLKHKQVEFFQWKLKALNDQKLQFLK
jgi:hypothetical protein